PQRCPIGVPNRRISEIQEVSLAHCLIATNSRSDSLTSEAAMECPHHQLLLSRPRRLVGAGMVLVQNTRPSLSSAALRLTAARRLPAMLQPVPWEVEHVDLLAGI